MIYDDFFNDVSTIHYTDAFNITNYDMTPFNNSHVQYCKMCEKPIHNNCHAYKKECKYSCHHEKPEPPQVTLETPTFILIGMIAVYLFFKIRQTIKK